MTISKISFALFVALLTISAHAIPITVAAPQDGDAASETSADEESESPAADDEVVGTDEDVAVKVDAVADDDVIQQRLQKIFAASDWFVSPEVEVNEGIVIISGRTDTDQRRNWASDVARRTEDVVAVVNNITVSQSVRLSESMETVGASLTTLWTEFLKQVPLMVAALAIILLTWLVARIAVAVVNKTAKRSHLRHGLQDLLLQLTTCGVWVVGLMVAAIVMFPGMTPAKLLTVLGLSSVAIGFAFKDIFENFFAGVLILWRFPFDKGDFIECGEVSGCVEDITVRMTSIRQVDGQLVVLPNAMLFKQPVYVLTSKASRRTTVICGIAYDEDVATARKVIQEAVQKCESVDTGHNVEIFAREFADSSINFEVTWWTGSTPLDERKSRDEVVESVKGSLDDAGIEIPFPYRTLTFKEPLTVANSEAASNDA